VRPSANSEPLLRIKRVLESYSLWQEEYRLRIIPVTGDLAMPFLGLETSRFSELASRIDVIYHCGAWVNHLYPYSVLRATNVSGTLEVIRLAAAYKTKPVHFVSTFFHAQSGLDGNGMQGHNRFADGYVQSKWIAEKMVEQAGARGLPVCIFRPSRITGQQQTGVSNLHDFMNLLIKGCVQLGKVPKWGRMEEYLTPVDYVAGAIVYLSRHRGNYGKAFDLIHSHNPVSWDEILFDWLKSLGFNLHQISYSDWRTELSGQPTNALYPFFSLFPDQENFINDGETGAPPGDGRRSKDSQNTLTGLANSGLVCPPLSQELLRTYVCYLKGVGFLEAP
jgi:thioester reductase-like protein